MLKTSHSDELDSLDRAILQRLQNDGRISHVELAQHVNLSPPAIHSRVKRLEQKGYIRSYVALLDWTKMGYDMLCFIHIGLQKHQPESVTQFRTMIQAMPEVLECHHVTGEFDYLLKVAIQDRADLERFVVNQLTPVPGIARIYTSLTLTEVKNTTALPVQI